MSSILDTITGGSFLPHVYCKKITVEKSANDSTAVDLTLLLELYQDKNKLLESTWLNNLGGGNQANGGNLIDSVFIQILPFTKKENINKLFPSFAGSAKTLSQAIAAALPGGPGTAAKGLVFEGSVYGAKNVFGDAYLPRNKTSEVLTKPNGVGADVEVSQNEATKVFDYPEQEEYVQNTFPYAISVSNSSMLGNLSQANPLTKASVDPNDTEWSTSLDGSAREETINGKTYYVVPFEHKITDFTGTDLGFAFYTFLNVPHWVKSLQILNSGTPLPTEHYTSFLEKFIIEGPINTEVVYKDGNLHKTREAFFLPDGTSWEGSVHLHTDTNPAPDGYYGDGGLSKDPSSPERGWMQGESHNSSNQQKLRLVETPNNKIVDFRYTTYEEPLFTALGFAGVTSEAGGKQIPVLTDATRKITDFLMPFQKEKRRDFNLDRFGRHLDSEKEFSKLYCSRTRPGTSRGMFLINTLELLKGQSNLFPLLFDKPGTSTDEEKKKLELTNMPEIEKILNKGKILSLKVYRDRVKKHVINSRYEKYANDESYEEPSVLIGTFSDYGASDPSLIELPNVKYFQNHIHRAFNITDMSVSKEVAGLYRYRLELEYKDGTYEYLYELYRELSKAKILLETYYDLATSYFTDPLLNNLNFDRTFIEKNSQYVKKTFKRYFHNGVFRSEFASLVEDPVKTPQFAENKPWVVVPAVLFSLQKIFGIFPKEINFTDPMFLNLLSPYPEGAGSPKSIELFSRFLKTAIYKVESLLAATKVNKTGSEIDTFGLPDSYTFNNLFNIVVSPADFTIKEHHSFDHPNELFEAINNKNIYSDYLASWSILPEGFSGLRTLSVNYFKQRCHLETAKLSPMAQSDEGFYGNNPSININWFSDQPDPLPTITVKDTFARTAFSYLSPSLIRFQDETKIAGGYNLVYKSFSPAANQYLNSEQASVSQLHHHTFNDYANYDALYTSLMNYTFNKQNNPDADLATESMVPPSPTTYGPVADAVAKNLKEPFKRLFDEKNMTFHNGFNYVQFFGDPDGLDKNAGANPISQTGEDDITLLTEEGYHPDFPLENEKFSDGAILPIKQFKRFIFGNKQNIIPLQASKAKVSKSWKKLLPNSFKLPFIQEQVNSGWKQKDVLHDKIISAFTSTDSEYDYSSFLFFQLNFTVKIEFFQTPNSNFKKDDNSWSLLKQQHLNLEDGEVLFCRLSMYDERLNKKLKLPMLDKHFLISNVGQSIIPVVDSIPAPEIEFTKEEEQEITNSIVKDFNDALPTLAAAKFWESRNQLKLRDFHNTLEKGMTNSKERDPMPVYEEIYGPDPSPRNDSGSPPAGTPGGPGMNGNMPFVPNGSTASTSTSLSGQPAQGIPDTALPGPGVGGMNDEPTNNY